MEFQIVTHFKPAGDQPQAIDSLVTGLNNNKKDQILLGVTGSGKTFTMANTDTYIEKDSTINEKIDMLRYSAICSLLERKDTITVASVSCIYGLGSPKSYINMTISLSVGDKICVDDFLSNLADLQYKRSDIRFERGYFRVRGDIIDIFPACHKDKAWRLSLFGNKIEKISQIDAMTGNVIEHINKITVFPNSYHITSRKTLLQSIQLIKKELHERLDYYYSQNKFVEAKRLEQRTNFDIEMMVTTGTCKGIENYSRYLYEMEAGYPPPTLFEYLPEGVILFVDESHVTIPQIGAMYSGNEAHIGALERVDIICKLRSKEIDVLVGVNLLREGLDIPECGLVAILDADKEGFLRSETSFIQTIGRAARNAEGKAILYADKITGSLDRALKETERRRKKQQQDNALHNITPKTIIKNISNTLQNKVVAEEGIIILITLI
ncbi:unnamed protein product [Ceratitis capitata]|uniref:(Mediterranean fruit fly) hypothetical protein n=1 Tax=Ceratitis capitata TaxID=7213 RepID=A0A811UWZ8_CERCA|nr:unnamed protein product [Ceratitis capitata]